MKALSKLRGKLFPRSEIGISAVFSEEEKSSQTVPPPASEVSPPAEAAESKLEVQRLELTPELEEALFPKTPVMISATFEPSKTNEISRVTPKENRDSHVEDDQQFPIV
jgi:hypothetical protein